MDVHELALKTYEAIQKRKKDKELKHRLDVSNTGWNGYTKYKNDRSKRYYSGGHHGFK